MIVDGLMIGAPLTLYVVPTACMHRSRTRKKVDADELAAAPGGMAHQPAE